MNKNYKVKLLTAVIITGFSFGTVKAALPILSKNLIVTETSNEWGFIKSKNGIKVSSRETHWGINTVVQLQFTNTTKEQINFSWSTSDTDGKNISDLQSVVIEDGQSLLFTKSSKLTNNQGKSTDFLVNINILKK